MFAIILLFPVALGAVLMLLGFGFKTAFTVTAIIYMVYMLIFILAIWAVSAIDDHGDGRPSDMCHRQNRWSQHMQSIIEQKLAYYEVYIVDPRSTLFHQGPPSRIIPIKHFSSFELQARAHAPLTSRSERAVMKLLERWERAHHDEWHSKPKPEVYD